MALFRNRKDRRDRRDERNRNRTNMVGVLIAFVILMLMYFASQVWANYREKKQAQAAEEAARAERLDVQQRAESAFSDWFGQFNIEEAALTEFDMLDYQKSAEASMLVNPELNDLIAQKARIDRILSLSESDMRTRQLELNGYESRYKELSRKTELTPDAEKEKALMEKCVRYMKTIQGETVSPDSLEALRDESARLSEEIDSSTLTGWAVEARTTYSDGTIANVRFVLDESGKIIITDFVPVIPAEAQENE